MRVITFCCTSMEAKYLDSWSIIMKNNNNCCLIGACLALIVRIVQRPAGPTGEHTMALYMPSRLNFFIYGNPSFLSQCVYFNVLQLMNDITQWPCVYPNILVAGASFTSGLLTLWVAACKKMSEKSNFDCNAMSRVITRLTLRPRHNALAQKVKAYISQLSGGWKKNWRFKLIINAFT